MMKNHAATQRSVTADEESARRLLISQDEALSPERLLTWLNMCV